MKKLVPLAAAVVALAAPAAFAQSSVTLFGILDVSARSVKNDQTQYQLATGGLQTSRLGFRATEDLGGGFSAGFWLEGELQPDTGNASGQNWQRRATVSLSGGFGELRLGRDKVPTLYNWEDFDPFKDAGVARSTRLQQAGSIVPTGGAYTTGSRASNMVSYLAPNNLGGFFGQASVAAGESVLGNKYQGVRAGWRNSALMVAGSFGTTEVTNAIDGDTWSIGASYDLKVVKLMGLYSSLEIGDASQKNTLVGVTVPVGLFEGRLSYQQMDGKGRIGNQEAKMYGLGGVYNLSKRTAVYASYSMIDNNPNSALTVATGTALTRGNESKGYEFGLRHAF